MTSEQQPPSLHIVGGTDSEATDNGTRLSSARRIKDTITWRRAEIVLALALIAPTVALGKDNIGPRWIVPDPGSIPAHIASAFNEHEEPIKVTDNMVEHQFTTEQQDALNQLLDPLYKLRPEQPRTRYVDTNEGKSRFSLHTTTDATGSKIKEAVVGLNGGGKTEEEILRMARILGWAATMTAINENEDDRLVDSYEHALDINALSGPFKSATTGASRWFKDGIIPLMPDQIVHGIDIGNAPRVIRFATTIACEREAMEKIAMTSNDRHLAQQFADKMPALVGLLDPHQPPEATAARVGVLYRVAA